MAAHESWTTDVLDAGAKPPSGRVRWLLWASIATAAVMAATLWAINSWQQNSSSEAIDAAYAEGIKAVESGEREVQLVVTYASPRLQVGPAPVKAELEALVLVAVARSLADVEQSRNTLESITVWPWHGEIKSAKTQALDTLDLRGQTLTRATGQGLGVPDPG
jgi:hypothetical protein